MSQFDPNAQFYAGSTHRPAVPQPFHPPLPTKTPVPTWAKVLIAVGCVVLVLPIVAAVAIPVFLNERTKTADSQVKQDVSTVAQAEELFWSTAGTYTADPGQLAVAEPESEVVILAADAGNYCVGGRAADGSGNAWYYSPAFGLTQQPCV